MGKEWYVPGRETKKRDPLWLFLSIIVLGIAALGVATERNHKGVSADNGANGARVGEISESNNCEVSEKFPDKIKQWEEIICQAGQDYNIDPDLIAALIWQESGGDPLAYSHSGAVGLMQVMPRDGIATNFQCTNGPCFANRPMIKELENPEFNVLYGVGMMAGFLDRNGGDIKEALKSYGPKDAGYAYADKIIELLETYGE